jgi:hypothetical protein
MPDSCPLTAIDVHLRLFREWPAAARMDRARPGQVFFPPLRCGKVRQVFLSFFGLLALPALADRNTARR